MRFRARPRILLLPRHADLCRYAVGENDLRRLTVVVRRNRGRSGLLANRLGNLQRVALHHEIQIAATSKRVQGLKLHPSFDLRVETISLR